MVKALFSKDIILHLTAAILFSILFIAAFILYHERLFLDSNYYIFKLINAKHFIIEHQRPTLIFGQVLPLIGVWLHLSLKSVLILASLNHIFFSLILYFYLVYYLKDSYAGWVLLLCLVCGTFYLFYFVTLEAFYGIQLLIVFHSFLLKLNPNNFLHYIWATVLWLFVVLAHPTLILCGGFILVYYVLSKPHNLSVRFIVVLILVTIIAFVFKSRHFDLYESQKLSYEFDFKKNGFYKQLYTVLFWKNLFKLWTFYYGEILCMVIATVTFLFFKHRALTALLMLSFFIGFIILVNITSLGCNIRTDYCEHTIIGIVPICIIPFMYSVFPHFTLNAKKILSLAFTCLILFRITETLNHSTDFTKRLQLFSSWVNACQNIPGQRFYISKNLADKEDEKIEWTLAIETLFISKMEHHSCKYITTEYVLEHDSTLGILKPDVIHYGFEKTMQINDLNPVYFTFEKGGYTKLEVH